MLHPVPLRSLRFFTAALCALAFWPGALWAEQVDPYGDCCVARVAMTDYNAWTATCGTCSANPGSYAISQPDPAKLVFVGPGGVTADSPYDTAVAICHCPSQESRRAREKQMRTYDGN